MAELDTIDVRYAYFNGIKLLYVCLVDNEYHVKKYQRIHDSLKLSILSKIATGSTQNMVNNNFDNAKISNKSISNIINSFDLKILNGSDIYDVKKVNINKCLYINVDETFCTLRINKNNIKKCRIRIAIFHTGIEKIKNRNQLLNKRFYFELVQNGSKIGTERFINKSLNFACNFYNNIDDVFKIIGGDSAKWIKNLTDYVDNSIYIVDKYHAIRNLRTINVCLRKILNYLNKANIKI